MIYFYIKLSGFLLFAILEIGVILELGFLGLKHKLPLIKSNKTIQHVAFWLIISLVSIILFNVSYSMTSDDFKNLMQENNSTCKEDEKYDKESNLEINNTTEKTPSGNKNVNTESITESTNNTILENSTVTTENESTQNIIKNSEYP